MFLQICESKYVRRVKRRLRKNFLSVCQKGLQFGDRLGQKVPAAICLMNADHKLKENNRFAKLTQRGEDIHWGRLLYPLHRLHQQLSRNSD